MIVENDYELELFNGEMGVVDFTELGEALAIFPERGVLPVDAYSNSVRSVPLTRIAHFQTAYAVTVHKAQGSEFDEVLIVLPEEDAPLLTRELLYTAVSRARKRVRIVGPKDVVQAALARRARRDSGLVDAIAKAEHVSLDERGG